MVRKVLVANRGEIAVRIIRECRDASIGAAAVYSEADREAMHVMLADDSICIGKAPVTESYLNISNIIEAALGSGCDAIHPGFGLLSENAEFARMCQENGLIFIGPSPETISMLGDKMQARLLARSAGVPVVPGSDGLVNSPDEAAETAERIGYPVLVKASAGGGGRGMRKAAGPEQIRAAYMEASLEAEKCFGNGEVYIEKLIQDPRHVEIQILADKYGNAVHLGERNCSVQRRNQKMVEEAPDASLSPELREKMGSDAVRLALAAGYENAGTVEYVVDRDQNYYFIEMNTRLQVEHGVTEMVTGVNIVREQLRIASGRELSIRQEDVKITGHAIECRINAESIRNNFAPSPGKVNYINLPAGYGVRTDHMLYSGCEISPYYDSLAAKIITHGENRLDAIRRMRRALSETIIEGIETTLPLDHLIMYNKEFLRGEYDTGFMDRHLEPMIRVYLEAEGES